MTNQISKGKWREIKGKIREQWGNLTEDELEKANGNIDKIAGKIQQKYGHSVEEAKKKLNILLKSFSESIS